MKLIIRNENIKCDNIFCKNMSNARLDMDSYKGIVFLCNDCLKQIQNLFKSSTTNQG